MGCHDLTVSWKMAPQVVNHQHCYQLLNPAETMCLIVPLVKLHKEFFQYSSCKSTIIASQCHMGPLICLAFIVHHIATFRPQRGMSWIKCLSRTPVPIILGRNRGLWLLICAMVARFCFICGCIVILYGDYHKWMLNTGVWYLEHYFFHSDMPMK